MQNQKEDTCEVPSGINSETSDPDGWAVSEIGRCPLPSSEREAAQLAVRFNTGGWRWCLQRVV